MVGKNEKTILRTRKKGRVEEKMYFLHTSVVKTKQDTRIGGERGGNTKIIREIIYSKQKSWLFLFDRGGIF